MINAVAATALASLVGSVLVHRTAAGAEIVAGVTSSGVVVGDEIYRSLSAAGSAAAGCAVNGWTYWSLRRDDVEEDFEVEIEALGAVIAGLEAGIAGDAYDRGIEHGAPRGDLGRFVRGALHNGSAVADARAELRSVRAERAAVRREFASFRRPVAELREAA